MVRVLMVRHAESGQNMVVARLEVETLRGRMDAKRGFKLLRRVTDTDEALTDVGLAQAEALRDYWAPLLEPYHQSGRLHMYSSPCLRTLQTAGPLAERLGVSPVVKPEISEFPGILAPGPERDVIFPRLMAAERKGDLEAVARIEAEMEGRWTRHGLTRAQIIERFPTFRMDPAINDDLPWYRYGAESQMRAKRRFQSVIDWLYHLRDTLPSDHVVVLVTHGNAIRHILWGLFFGFEGEAPFRGSDNTAVNSVTLKKEADVNKLLPGAMWFTTRRINIEFLNRVDHLVAVHAMDRLSGYLHGTSPEQHHYDADPTHDAFIANLHEAATLPTEAARRSQLFSKL